jgi:hypothetical protein
MAIAITNLGVSTGTTEQAPDIRNLTDATSYTIPSWDPPNDGVVLLCILNGQNTITDVAIDNLTGNGNTWSEITAVEFDTGRRILTIFGAFGADLTTGETVIDFGTDTQLACYVSIFQITGAEEDGIDASNTFGLSESTTGSGTSASHNWAGSVTPDSRPLYFVAHVANEVVSQDASQTKIDDMNGAGPALGMVTAWEDDGFTDPSASFTWATTIAYGVLALEILAPGALEVPKYTLPGRRVPLAMFGPALLPDLSTVLYTCPAGVRAMLRYVQVSNPTGGEVEFTLAIGDADVPADRIIANYGIPGDSVKHWFFQEWLDPAEVLTGYGGTDATLVLRMDGYERPAG